ncbi:hypothetical protein [Methylobacterium tarhaniae]|uniref:hypothetical protein n=1 Tax=Methylobacterium tarhaniae TaxID=1187852 RepID=UPI003CFFFE12
MRRDIGDIQMLYRLIFGMTIIAETGGSAFVRQTQTIGVWGARIEVPNEAPDHLFGNGAAPRTMPTW